MNADLFWLPIESHPTRGRIILTDGLNVACGEWIVSEECWFGTEGMAPTHWLPLDALLQIPFPLAQGESR